MDSAVWAEPVTRQYFPTLSFPGTTPTQAQHSHHSEPSYARHNSANTFLWIQLCHQAARQPSTQVLLSLQHKHCPSDIEHPSRTKKRELVDRAQLWGWLLLEMSIGLICSLSKFSQLIVTSIVDASHIPQCDEIRFNRFISITQVLTKLLRNNPYGDNKNTV